MSTLRIAFALFFLNSPIFAQSYLISTVAGSDRLRDGGPATSTLLRQPMAAVMDATGNLYISDYADYRIRKVTPKGVISTWVGTGVMGFSGDNGPAQEAQIAGVRDMAIDPAGNLYLADRNNSRVRKVTPAGVITTVAGNGRWAYAGDGGMAVAAQLDPAAVAIDSSGNLYIGDLGNYRIRKVTPAGVISTIAGMGGRGYAGDGGPAIQAQIDTVTSIAIDSAGNIYFTDYTNSRIRKIDAAGVITTVAGNGDYIYQGDGVLAKSVGFNPSSISVDKKGDIYIADTWNDRIRKVTISTGIINTEFGNGQYGFFGDGGPAWGASFANPLQISVGADGSFCIVDSGNQRIRKVDSGGVIKTVAGAPAGDGVPAVSAFLNRPSGIAVGAGGSLLIADDGNYRVRRVDSSGTINTIAGRGLSGYGGDGGQAVSAWLAAATAVAVDASGNYYVADTANSMIRKISPQGIITRFAGNGGAGVTGNGGPALGAQIGEPTSIAFDGNGNAYINDIYNGRIRKITAAGIISSVAGNGSLIYAGDNVQATSASLFPRDIAVDRTGVIYVVDSLNHRIRKIDTSGVITTIAGTGAAGYSGDGGPAITAQINLPSGVALDAAGNIYIADDGNSVVRRITSAGVISTIAGNGKTPTAGDGGPALAAQLDPFRIAVDPSGVIYVSDWLNDRVRKLTPQQVAALVLVSGNNQSAPVGTALATPLVVAVRDGAGNPVAGIAVTFTVASGAATLSSATAVTAGDGTARTTVTLGGATGPVTVTAASSGLTPVTFALTATQAVTLPVIPSGGVVGSGLSAQLVRALSPNAIATVFGSNFRPEGPALVIGGGDLVDGKIPKLFGGVCVLVGGTPAPIFAVHATQVNFQAPVVSGASTTVQVARDCGTPDEVRSNAETVAVQPVTPEFFYFAHPADGKKPIAAVYALNAFLNVGVAGLVSGGQFVPAKPGDLLTFYMTGLGITSPAFAAGELPDKAGSAPGPLQVSIGGITLAAADVLYAGVTPSAAGLYQINVRVPADVADGNQPVVVTLAGVTAPTGYIAVQR